MYCRNCGAEIGRSAYCPRCGAPQKMDPAAGPQPMYQTAGSRQGPFDQTAELLRKVFQHLEENESGRPSSP